MAKRRRCRRVHISVADKCWFGSVQKEGMQLAGLVSSVEVCSMRKKEGGEIEIWKALRAIRKTAL